MKRLWTASMRIDGKIQAKLLFLALLLVFFTCTHYGCGRTSRQSLETPRVEGGLIRGEFREGVWTFLGIPYAAPPKGDLRWKEPHPPEAWKGIRECKEYGPSCPQPPGGWMEYLKVEKTDEDCLYLNIWSPASSTSDRLPVMVWIHGGAFRSGSGSLKLYDGTNLARRGVVVVTFNYRLGPLGFLAHPLLSRESPWNVSGNYGLLDQLAALSWVKRNIRAFGGDPENVTVFGESAGGMSILFLMTSPLAEGLFQKAIVESGPLPDFGLPTLKMLTLSEAEQKGVEFARKLGIEQESQEPEKVLECLRAVPVEDILKASSRSDPLSVVDFGPVVDGHVLPEKPVQAFAHNRQHRVPLLIGVNADDGSLFAPDMDPERYRILLALGYGSFSNRVFNMFPATTQGEVKEALSKLITQLGFSASARFAADCCSLANQPIYLYLFNRVPDDPRAAKLGSFHGLEIIYVFDNLQLSEEISHSETDVRLASAMASYWTNFAIRGDPNGEGLPSWPTYRPEESLYLELGEEIRSENDLYGEAYRLVRQWRGF